MRSRFPTYTPMSTITLSFLTLPLLSDTFSFLSSCFDTSSEKLKATLPCCSVFLRQSCAEGVGEGLDAATLLDALLDTLFAAGFSRVTMLRGGLQPCHHAAGFSSIPMRRMLWDSHALRGLVPNAEHAMVFALFQLI